MGLILQYSDDDVNDVQCYGDHLPDDDVNDDLDCCASFNNFYYA